jgi:hypothetical protein
MAEFELIQNGRIRTASKVIEFELLQNGRIRTQFRAFDRFTKMDVKKSTHLAKSISLLVEKYAQMLRNESTKITKQIRKKKCN